MKFSARTIQILKNFSTIHQAMIFNPGKEIKVMSDMQTIVAKADIDTNIPSAFAIYDMPKFLSAISMFQDPELEIRDGYMVISESSERINYNFAEPTLIRKPPASMREVDNDVVFDLPNNTINRLFKGAAITSAANICVTGNGQHCYIEALTTACGSRTNINTGASYRAELGPTDKNFNFVFLTENMNKLMADDYRVTISREGIAHFKATDLEYWVCVEAESSFGK